jgi:pimeloyl-ACP methyl ester carboxylesterase
MSNDSTVGRNIEVNGVSLYVEEHGEGDPIVLVHGGTLSSAMWEPTVSLLADRYRVITFDSRGHGRSTNPSGKLTYPLIADDTAALIETLGLERPVVGGWSDGGQIALEIGMRYPTSARALIAGGVMHNYQDPEGKAMMRDFLCVGDNDKVDSTAFETRHSDFVDYMSAMHTQSPDQWRTVLQQTSEMWFSYPSITREMLADVTTPTLVISGDRDGLILLEHTIDFYEWLPNAELSILPGADHFGVFNQPAMFVATIVDYVERHGHDQ